MRGFFTTVCIFSIILGIILLNKIYLTHTATNFLERANELEEQIPKDISQIKSLQEDWDKSKDIMQISVAHKRIDTVTDLMDSLLAYAFLQDEAEYKKTAALLINALEEIRRFEEFSAVNIL